MRHIAILALAASAASAHAGRPLFTDDAAAAPVGTCQAETWQDRATGLRYSVFGGACGVLPGVEVGAEVSRGHASGVARATAGAAGIKWVPQAASFATPLGSLRLGVKAGMQGLRDTGNAWARTGHGVAALASLEVVPSFALHANVSVDRDRGAADTDTSVALAAVWSPRPAGFLFAEMLVAARANGGGTRAFGGRYWVREDRVGLDFAVSRGPGGPLTWTAGLGFYGLGLR